MAIDRTRLNSYALFKHFWNDKHPGLSHEGLDEVNQAGAAELERYAKEHNLDGTPTTDAAAKTIDADERELMSAILQDNFYGGLFEQDARPLVMSKFGIDAGTLHLPVTVNRPEIAGAVVLPERVSRFSAATLAETQPMQLPIAFEREYSMRRAYFEDPSLSSEEKGLRVLGLLRDYAKALWTKGEQVMTEEVGNALLDKFATLPYAATYGSLDFNGAGFSAAQSVVLGLDPFDFKHAFPEAGNTAKYTYMAMDGAMAPAMKFVDQYLVAKGKEAGAEALEKRPVLGYILGQPSGHTKNRGLSESTPFASTGLNWGVLLFPWDEQVKSLPVKAGFEFPIDALDSYRDIVHAKNGERLEVKDKQGNPVTISKELELDAAGKPVAWFAKFKNAEGVEIPASEVIGLIVDRNGNVKGDGKANDVADMGWWGYCDRNTAQQLYKSRFKIPNLDRPSIKVKAGEQIITIPQNEAQRLIDMDVPDLAKETFSGFRFDGNPQQVRLKSGRVIQGKVPSHLLQHGPGAKRIGGDSLMVFDAPNRPLLGDLQLQVGDSKIPFQVSGLESITENADGTVTVKTKGGMSETGKLTDSVPWEKAVTENGKRVLKQDASMPIRGAISVEMWNGKSERIATTDIENITGETMVNTRFSQFMTYVSHNEGMYATDSVTAPMVSNGMRWVNKLELDEKNDGTKPAWVGPYDLEGLNGKLELKEGDKVIYGRGMYRYGGHGNADSTAFAGWYQVRDGRIVNEGFIEGEPDFSWGSDGPLNWLAPSSFNQHMDPELRVALMVNGVVGMNDELAKRLNLPSNWKSYLVEQDTMPAPTPPTAPVSNTVGPTIPGTPAPELVG
jgi:hypothetical protein